MSRWSAERFRIGVSPSRVDVLRLGFGPGRRVRAQAGVACTPREGPAPWQAALDALEQPLADLGAHAGAAAVVVSNHWVRYLVLPWQTGVTRGAELETLARLRFEQTFGVGARDWTIRVCDGGYGAAHVACAVDAALLSALRARLQAHGLRLASVQPLLMTAINAVRREIGGDAAFALVEPGRVCLSLLRQGRWQHIASRRCGADPAGVVEQELATRDAPAAPARLDVLLVGDEPDWPLGAARPVRLLGRSTGGTRRSLAALGLV